MATKTSTDTGTVRQVTGLLIALSVEFVLGVTLTTVINYDPSKHSAVQTTVLGTHIALGLAIALGGIARLRRSIKARSLVWASAIGVLSSLGAFASGDAARRTGNSTAVYIMSLCFILGFLAYGHSLLVLQKKARD